MLISHASKVILKILEARLQRYVNQKIPDIQVGFWRGRGARNQIANIQWVMEKARGFQKKHPCLLYWISKAFDCVDHKRMWKILKNMGMPRPPYLCPEKSICRSRSTGHGITDWFQTGKGVPQAVYCHSAYLTYMQSMSCKMPDWMNHKLESRLPAEISITSDIQMIPL